ncbi:MAG: TolC family outer membrane protein [Proteobacteria bacterium]|nr:TolC family outer membrane protein [Pseudomonadota bacterium]MBU1648875.1 TolC family outer membrane protein [Pseudomonadota bacterium]MBU1985881.1 TolC family outer membrane protein [Pseudomonadota bacterium]
MKISKLLSTTLIGGTLLVNGSYIQAETLQDAIGTMLQTNPEIRSMAHNRLGRDEEVRQAKSGYLPEINFSAGVGVQDVQEPTSDNLTPQQYTLSLRQNVFTGLATNNEVDRQKARVQSQAYSLQGASENTALRTAEVYLNVLRQQELHRLSQENLDTHVRIADQINLRSESGVASKSDSDQVAGRLALAQANIVATNTNLVDAQTNYLAVVGHLPTDLQEPTPPDSLLPASLEDAEAEAIKMHPTLKSAGADLEARQKQYEVAKAPYWPIIDLEVDQNWEEDYDTVGKKDSLIAMARLRYNLFHGFKDEARRAETVELVSEAREIRNNTHRQVVESMRLSWMAYQAVKDQIKYLEQRVDFATSTSDSYTKQFNLGKRTLLDVLDSEAEVIDAKRALVEARHDGLYAQYRILNGLGQLVKSFDKEWPKESQVSGDNKEKESKKDTSS